MNTSDALLAIDHIRAAASASDVSKEELQLLVSESTQLLQRAIEAIIYFQVAEELVYQATGVRVPNEIVTEIVTMVLE